MDIFARYHEAQDIVEGLPDGENKEYLRKLKTQLLHLVQGRKVAVDSHRRYINEMDAWEYNILKEIKDKAKSVNSWSYVERSQNEH